MEGTVFCMLMVKKLYQLKAKDSEIKTYPLRLGNISKTFTVNNMKKTGSSEYVYHFSVDYNTFDNNDIKDIDKCLQKKHNMK